MVRHLLVSFMNRHSQVYIDFYELHHDSFESIMFFYERNRRTIRQLPLEEQLELLSEYLNACFQTAQYRKYLLHVDELIENLVMHNVEHIHGRDEYTNSLFKKAASLFNLERYEESEFIVKQLCRMEPGNKNARILYRRNLYQNLNTGYKYIRHMSAVGLLMAAVLTAIDLFAWAHLSETWSEVIRTTRNAMFSFSMLALLGLELKIRWLSARI